MGMPVLRFQTCGVVGRGGEEGGEEESWGEGDWAGGGEVPLSY